jgi:hypothetical protein
MRIQKFLLLGVLILTASRIYSQAPATSQSLWVDSLAGVEAVGIQQQFHLSSGQTDTLHQGYVLWYAARRTVFSRYWKTDSFPPMILRADRLRDSIYMLVLGQQQFHAYKDSVYRRRERQQQKTSLSIKPSKS